MAGINKQGRVCKSSPSGGCWKGKERIVDSEVMFWYVWLVVIVGSIPSLLTAGGIAGAIGAWIATPADVVKTR